MMKKTDKQISRYAIKQVSKQWSEKDQPEMQTKYVSKKNNEKTNRTKTPQFIGGAHTKSNDKMLSSFQNILNRTRHLI